MGLLQPLFELTGKLIEPDIDYIKTWVSCCSQREWTEFLKRKVHGWSKYGISHIFNFLHECNSIEVIALKIRKTEEIAFKTLNDLYEYIESTVSKF